MGSWEKHREQIGGFRLLEDDWNGYGSEKPNERALMMAEAVLKSLQGHNLEPSLIAPSAENGVAFSFSNGDKYAILECYNNGECAWSYMVKTSGKIVGGGSSGLNERIDAIFFNLVVVAIKGHLKK